MKNRFILKITRCIDYIAYIILLVSVVYIVCDWAFRNEYFKNYVEGFLTNRIQKEDCASNVDPNEVIILDIQNWPNVREDLPELIDTIMSCNPKVLGVDIKLFPRDDDDVSDSILIATIKKYDNIVLPFDKFEDEETRYPFCKEYDYFPNVCYTNWGAQDAAPRYLELYDTIDGKIRTSFWARLWELNAGISSGELTSKRRFINFNLNSNLVLCGNISNFDDVSFIKAYLKKIVIIGVINDRDIFHVPYDDKDSITYEKYRERNLMPGVQLIGISALTIGDNEMDNCWADLNREWIGLFVLIVLSSLLCVLHFSQVKWIQFVRVYGNLFQFAGGIVLFVLSNQLSPSMDEWWYVFRLVAILLLMAPVVADGTRCIVVIYQWIRKRLLIYKR